MTRSAFGEMLRRQRERHGVSLFTIAEQTKISRRLLAELEGGDCSRWPGGIYARGYVRSYASEIGLDAAEVVADFCALFPEFAPPSREEREGGAGPPPPVSARSGWLAYLRDLFHRADSRLDLLLGIERPE